MNEENELWEKAFNIMLSKGDVYSYDFKSAIAELKKLGFSISQDTTTGDNTEEHF